MPTSNVVTVATTLSSLRNCDGGPSCIVRKVVGNAFAKGTLAAALLVVPRGGGGLFDAARRRKQEKNIVTSSNDSTGGKEKVGTSLTAQNNNEKQKHSNKSSWSIHLQSSASSFTTAIITSIYVIYPISLLLLFRISETISALRLFEHHHRCHQLGELGHCASLVLFHGGSFVTWLGLAYCFHRRRELPFSMGLLLAAITAVMLGLYKGMVDGYLLFHPSSLDGGQTSLKGKVAVITGANRGIGLETAKMLAEMGAHVVMTCRSISKCQPFVNDINSNDNIAGSASAAVLNLHSLESVTLLATELTETYPTIDYVFCNAGTTPQYELTMDGFEDAFGGMHLAHMALVLGLLPSLQNNIGNNNNNKTDEPSRVIMVSSEMAINAAIGVFSPHDPTLTEFFDKNNVRGEITRGDGTFPDSLPAYGRAKLANILFALELNRRMAARSAEDTANIRPVIAHAVHTGAVNTESSRQSIQHMFAEQWPKWLHPGLGWLVGQVYFPLLWRPVKGGTRVLLCAALSRQDIIVGGGQYLDALGHPLLPVEEEDVQVLESVQSGDTYEDVMKLKRWNATIYLDPIQALQLADARWSKHLYEMSLQLLEQHPHAKCVVELAP